MKSFDDFTIPNYYYTDAITPLRISDDFNKNYRDKNLSNEEMKEKVKAVLRLEKEAKENSSKWIHPSLKWEKLLQTKLFQNSKI